MHPQFCQLVYHITYSSSHTKKTCLCVLNVHDFDCHTLFFPWCRFSNVRNAAFEMFKSAMRLYIHIQLCVKREWVVVGVNSSCGWICLRTAVYFTVPARRYRSPASLFGIYTFRCSAHRAGDGVGGVRRECVWPPPERTLNLWLGISAVATASQSTSSLVKSIGNNGNGLISLQVFMFTDKDRVDMCFIILLYIVFKLIKVIYLFGLPVL